MKTQYAVIRLGFEPETDVYYAETLAEATARRDEYQEAYPGSEWLIAVVVR